MPNSRLREYLHVVPTLVFLGLAGALLWFPASQPFRPPSVIVVPALFLLSALPFLISFLAARSYLRQGSRLFLLFGCAMLAFGIGTLLSTMGRPRYGTNFAITLYDMGALLGGLYHLCGVGLLFFGSARARQPSRRRTIRSCVAAYVASSLFLVGVSLLTSRALFPPFFEPDHGPTLVRHIVLSVAGVSYVFSAVLLVALHAQTRMMFLSLYSNGLFLTAIELAIALGQKGDIGLFSLAGTAALCVGNLYFAAAILRGSRETRAQGTSLPAYLSELFRVHLDDMVKARTTELMDLNAKLRDVIAQREAADVERLRAEAAYRSLIEHSMSGMAIFQDGRVTFANQPLAEICGYSVAELLRMKAEDFGAHVHREDRARFLASVSRPSVAVAASPAQRLRLLLKSGATRWVETQSVFVDRDGRPSAQVSFKDVNAEKAAEEQLELAHLKARNLAAHLLRVREEERRKVAQEIHDELGQTLVALKMNLHWLAKKMGKNEKSGRERVRETIDLGNAAISTVRRIASDLRPRMLDDLGLEAALDWLCADFSRRTGVDCSLTAAVPRGLLGKNAATILYRFTQEALANVGRHSQAERAAVRLSVVQGVLTLQVEDNGTGITAQQAAAPDSYGLIGLRERVEQLGGDLSIEGGTSGTTLVARFPLPENGGLA